MAIVKSGPYVGFSGTVDGITYYQLPNGTTVAKKKNKKSTKSSTPAQQAAQDVMVMISQFMKPFEAFIKMGYAQEAKKQGLNPHNAMLRHIWKNALEGAPGDRKVNLHQLLVTKGELPPANENSVQLNAKGLAFTWSTELKPKRSHHSDQVIMVAYFPELQELEFKVGGAERSAGQDVLLLDGIEKGYPAEIFISFITNDRSGISDSIYLGQLNW